MGAVWPGTDPARVEDAPDNANNRYDVAAAINTAYPGQWRSG